MKAYERYLEERLKGEISTFPHTSKGSSAVATKVYEAPFTERDFDDILKTSNKAINANAIRGGIDGRGDIYAWRYDVWTRAMEREHPVKFDYEIDAVLENNRWRVFVKSTPRKGDVDEDDISNINDKVSHFIGRLPGTPPTHYVIQDLSGKKTIEKEVQ